MMASHAMILLFLLLRVMLTPLYAASAFHLLSSNSLMLFYIFRFRMYSMWTQEMKSSRRRTAAERQLNGFLRCQCVVTEKKRTEQRQTNYFKPEEKHK